MAANAEINWLGQQRVDVEHLRMIESGVRYDLDALAYCITGDAGYIVNGFEVAGTSVGIKANRITVKTSGSRMVHPLASETGSIFAVPTNRAAETLDASTNSRVLSECQPSSTNYIGLDLHRSADSTTSNIVQFLDPSENEESPQKVPLRRTLDYVWVVTQTDFSFNRSVVPWAIVTTDSKNVVTAFVDARSLLCRLAPGGSVTTEITPYGWPGGRPKSETTSTSAIAGDKAIKNLKQWMNAIMTRLWELGGGQYWYSITADRNVNFRTGGSVFSSTGESFEVVSGNLHWQGLSFTFDNSSQSVITVNNQLTDSAGLTDLADGECIYVDLDRNGAATVTAQKGVLTTLGGSSRPGQRWVVACRVGSNYYVSGQPWPIGSNFSVATITHFGTVKTNLDFDPAAPVAATIDTSVGGVQGSVTGAGLSHNTDIGDSRLYTGGDIQVGRGEGAGDQDIKLVTDGQHTTRILGQGDADYPILQIVRGGFMGSPSEPVGGFGPNITPLDLGNDVARFEGTHAWSLKSIIYLPLPPSGESVGTRYTRVKYFVKSNKTWKYPVNYMTANLNGFTWTWNATYRTLTRDQTGSLEVDGTNVPDADDRLLFNVAGYDYNGIYVVTNPGGVGVNPILTMATDANGADSIEAQGFGFNIFDGSAVAILSGDHYGGKFAVLDAPTIAETVDQSIYGWKETDSMTIDELCVMWTDGSYTAIASGPEYDGWT